MGADYDDYIAQGMNYWICLQFYYIWRCLIHNINFLKNHTELGLYGDETRWETAIYGETGAGITFQIANNPVITKGGQTVLVSDIHRIRPCA